MKNKNKYLLLTLLVVLGISGCSEPVIPVVKTPLVDVYTVPVKKHQDLQKFPAVLQASHLISLGFRVSGELIDIAVSSGQKVKKGDLIAKIDATDFELSVKDKQSKMQLAQVSMQRAKKMVELENMAQSTLDELEAKYRMAQAEYEYARVKLNYVALKAPFTGIIASVPADNYQTTAIGQVVVTLHRIDKVEVKVDLPDVILAAANRANTDRASIVLDLTLDAYPGFNFKARYKEHTTEQNQDSKNYLLILELSTDPTRVMLPGMPGSVEIDMAKLTTETIARKIPLQAIVLPDSYPLNSGERVLWRIKSDDSVEQVKVRTLGLADSANMEVFGDIKPGDRIATSGLMYLKSGVKVNVRPSSLNDKEMML